MQPKFFEIPPVADERDAKDKQVDEVVKGKDVGDRRAHIDGKLFSDI